MQKAPYRAAKGAAGCGGMGHSASAELGYVAQFGLVDDGDVLAVDGYESLTGEGRERAYGVARRHVRQACEVCAAHTEAYRLAAILVFQF